MKAEIKITLKKTVADPQGLTVKHALESLNYEGIEEVRMGKFITIQLSSKNKEAARKEIDSMCGKLLANPVIEDYSFSIEE